MATSKLILEVSKESLTLDLEEKLNSYLKELGIESASLEVVSDASTGIPKGRVFVILAEGSDAEAAAGKIGVQDFEGHRIAVTTIPPKKEDAIKETVEPPVEEQAEGPGLPRA